MKKQGKQVFCQKIKRSRNVSTWLRTACAVLCAWMLLFSFVGCDSYATPADLSLLENSLADALDELDALKKDHASAQNAIETLKNSNTASAQKIDQLEENANGAEKELEALQGNHAAAQKEITSLKEKNEALQQVIDSLKGDKEDALQEIEKLKEKIQDLQNGLDPVKKLKIYIDQGHNPTSYHNSGAEGNGLYEQDLTFKIGKLLAELLEEDGRFEIRLSRPTASTVLGTDGDSSLDLRVQGAKDFGADYFISLHTNSFEMDSVNGIEVYVAETNSVSYSFGQALLQGLLDSTGLYSRGMKLNPNLRVLKNATMPAALLEMGFITNATDASLLSQHPELFAEGIYNGILSYFDLEPNTPPSAQE